MQEITLKWFTIPSFLYHGFNEHKDINIPLFGPGLYQLIYWTGSAGCQAYYIGLSESEVGDRLWDHYKKLINGKWWLPSDFKKCSRDWYHYIRTSDEKDGYLDPEDAKNTQHLKKIGEKLIENSYIAIALWPENTDVDMKDIESLLHHGVLIKNELTKKNKPRDGWIGETTSVLPEKDIIIHNTYAHVAIEKMMENYMERDISSLKLLKIAGRMG